MFAETIASIDVAARLYRAGGEFFLTEPVMSKLMELPLFKGVRIAVVLAWLMLCAAIAFFSVRVLKIWQLLMLAGLGGAALVGAMLPEPSMTVITQKVAGLFPESVLTNLRTVLGNIYTDNKFAHAGTEISKLGHFMVFACFGLVMGLMWRRCGIYFGIAAIVVLALATEALQTMVYGRTTSTGDLIVDVLGGLTGLFFGVLIAGLLASVIKDSSHNLQPEYNEEEFSESNRY